ncbi:uncharacterized protein TNCV_76711 [Trichonephila clavipes]|nr:uncharacterized protein TNCV_76711 [Trichonephila clavipes]
MSSNPGEDIDACKCIVPSRHGGTLNSRRAATPLVRLVEGEERWEAPDHPKVVLPQNWGVTELNHSVTCMVLWLTTGVTCPFAMMNFVGLDLSFVDQVALVTTTTFYPFKEHCILYSSGGLRENFTGPQENVWNVLTHHVKLCFKMH